MISTSTERSERFCKYFFSNVPPNVGFIFALLAFAAGFAVRPFGALIFGRLGDLVDRKYTFLVTMTLMGVGTFFIGSLPGLLRPGHPFRGADLDRVAADPGPRPRRRDGGAAIYVAEHAPANKRGYYTSWIQTTATLGLFMAPLDSVWASEAWMGEAVFGDRGLAHPVPVVGHPAVVSIGFG